MSCQRLYFLHLRHLPNVDFVEGVAMGADEFVDRSSEHEIADLRPDIQTFGFISSH